jgi:hypothetical protein
VLRLDVHSDVDFHSTGVAPAWSKKRNVERKVGATGMTGHELGRMRKEAHFKGKGICQSRTALVSRVLGHTECRRRFLIRPK